MVNLSVSDAVELVRKNLDELDPNGSIMMDDENGSSADYGDNPSLNDIIARNLPEAINAVHLAAPVQLLEGEDYTFTKKDTVSISKDGVLSFSLGENSEFLRLVAFQASDSPIVVTDVIGEASPEGRKQLNPYLRGLSDRPRLVLSQGRHTGPVFKYYTLDDASVYEEDASDAIKQFSYIPEHFFAEYESDYSISRRLRQNIIDCLTAKVLETYNDQRASSFYQKANNYPTI